MTPDQIGFIHKIAPAAVESERTTGILASVTIAQAILESGWGKTKLASAYSNFFGIKASQLKIAAHQYVEFNTQEEEAHTLETLKDKFATYSSFFDCFQDHARLLQTPHYAAAMAVKDDLDKFCYMLGPKSASYPDACGYSTLTAYHDRLTELINLYGLRDYTAKEPTQ